MNHSLRIFSPALGAALLVATVLGCGQSDGPQRVSVSGTVSVDGEPLSDGTISFTDSTQTAATEAIPISGGEFSGEVIPGTKRVEIHGYETVTPDIPSGAPEAGTPIQKQVLPPRYNDQSELTKEITAGGDPLEFQLTTGQE